MAQNSATVTAPNPTPPTNFNCTGATPPNPPNFTRRSVGPPTDIITNPPPYFDDGSALTGVSFASNTAALASGTTAADNNTGTTAGTVTTAAGGTGFNSVVGTYPVQGGLVPASSSVAHEGAGTETIFTQSYSASVYNPAGALVMVGCGPALTAGTSPQPNQTHASSLSPATNPTLTSIASIASGGGTGTCSATGTNFTRQSVLNVNGISYPTTWVSATNITAVTAKKATAGTLPVYVITGGVVVTATVNWTFS